MSGIGDGLGAEDVVGDGVGGVVFHQRHVLVRGGVEDGVRFDVGDDAERGFGIDHVVQHGFAGNIGKTLGDLAVDFEEGVFAALHEDQQAGLEGGADAADFAADAAACAGDEHTFVFDCAADEFAVDAVGGAADEFGHVEAGGGEARFEHAGGRLGEQVGQRGDETLGDVEAAQGFTHFADEGPLVLRQADDGRGEGLGGVKVGECGEGAQDRQARDVVGDGEVGIVGLAGVVIADDDAANVLGQHVREGKLAREGGEALEGAYEHGVEPQRSVGRAGEGDVGRYGEHGVVRSPQRRRDTEE